MLARRALLAIVLASASAAAEPRLSVSTSKPKQGDPVLVTVVGSERKPTGTGGRAALQFFAVKRGWQAVFAVPLEDAPAEVTVAVDGIAAPATLAVQSRELTEETATVDPDMAEPPAERRKQIENDNLDLIGALKNTDPALFGVPFRRPGSGKATSNFGAWRIFNGGYRSQHLGMDVAAKLGAPVRAIQRGRVALIHEGFLTGRAVVLVHGAGIASTYFHLDEVSVSAGDEVPAGATLGHVGMTGRTTGAHIHLGIWASGGWVDPAAFLRLKIAAPVP